MSISALDSSTLAAGFGMGQMGGMSGRQKMDSDEMAEFIVSKDDADGDGLLSLGETPLDEDRFNSIDADGDGFISSEELSADAESRKEEMNLMGQLTMQMAGIDPSQMAASIFDQDDADGDGLLTLDETPLSEEIFNSIDTDGDGSISAEELTADIESKAAEGMPAPPPGAQEQAAAASSESSSSSSSDSEEDYDVLDLNEDGVVSMSELFQAFQNGDSSLSSLFPDEGEGNVSAMTQRMAMQAYQAQMS
ncbi:EF-hand domain-containing protein [Pseudodesulfovibrio sp. zrk46]|uniref:EF-hand domain-containing protein n=1 Tax=Pseudodesulfovibrio sp. zrk46 TaxID=2725288 RepID=UPI001449EAB6|nr:EF-hand domain-containing protein [Pseudodesulfovibrio sp. zrk46]QJB56089.1 hypothetical protein HFN16_06540 [Pseudodesulfovibrio sp. zrk46]